MRRQNRDSGQNDSQDRWLVSYADFITLLFAFFVVMYSISSVNEGKYKVLSDTLEGVFNTRQKSLEPVQIGELSPRSENVGQTDSIDPIFIVNNEASDSRSAREVDPDLQQMTGELQESFKDLIFSDQAEVRQLDGWVEISLSDQIVFESGTVLPSEPSFEVIQRLARLLKDRDNGIFIEGHTDNINISSGQFESNWELSAARAATFLRLLGVEGIDESRMAAVGYGQYRPIVRNDTPAGRKKNRRIVLLISKSSDVRESLLN